MTIRSRSFTHDPERDLLLERLVDLPVELVWTAWTDPEHLTAWCAEPTFEAVGTSTRYSARAIHASRDAAAAHAEMGFTDGWSTALDQLVEHMSQDTRS